MNKNQERYEQKIMNELYHVDKDTYQHLIEHSDCFYDDSVIKEALDN